MTSASTVIADKTRLSRRSLLAGSAAAAGAFSFGFAIPVAGEAQAQDIVFEWREDGGATYTRTARLTVT